MASSTSTTANDVLRELQPMFDAWRAGDLETLMACYADEGLEFSDYALNHLKLDKTAVREIYQGFFNSYTDMSLEIRSASGDRNNLTLEASFHVTGKESPLLPAGQSAIMPGTSILKLNSEGKIVLQHDYFCIPLDLLMGKEAAAVDH